MAPGESPESASANTLDFDYSLSGDQLIFVGKTNGYRYTFTNIPD